MQYNMEIPQKIELSDNNFKEISQVVYNYCGINLKTDKRELIHSRLSKLIRRKNLTSFDDYLKLVLGNTSSPDFTEFIDHLSTNLTSFFRENQHFDYLRENVLPQLQKNRPVRIRCWSAGCSTGEEPYSLAITLAENLPDIQRADIKILASDISTQVLSSAAKGCYAKARFSDTPASLVKKYFDSYQDGDETAYKVKDKIKRFIIFKKINLMESWPVTTKLDFIFCRNVMIYFDKATQQKLVNRYHEMLSPGGTLFIGHSESLSSVQHPFKYVAPTVYQKPRGIE